MISRIDETRGRERGERDDGAIALSNVAVIWAVVGAPESAFEGEVAETLGARSPPVVPGRGLLPLPPQLTARIAVAKSSAMPPLMVRVFNFAPGRPLRFAIPASPIQRLSQRVRPIYRKNCSQGPSLAADVEFLVSDLLPSKGE